MYAYRREHDGKKVLVVLNFTEKKTVIQMPEAGNVGETLINNYDHFSIRKNEILLLPYQALIFELK